jgi:O-antigen/teichoic acid export membrane protein
MSAATTSRAPSGALLILLATVVAGIAGYLVTFIVYREVGSAPYALFAVFWAALYLLVGALSGVQQEIARATRPIEIGDRVRASRARSFAIVLALLIGSAIVASAPLWASRVFADNAWPLVWPLAVGAVSYVLVATLSGSLYGASQWRSVALMIGVDGLLRLALLCVALVFTTDIVVLAWAVALPFPLAIMLLWPIIRGGFVGRTDLDVGHRGLSWNVARTVLASTSTAVLVSGFPLLLGAAAVSENQAFVGELIFTITLTRAPLIVTVMSLQSLLLVRFRDGSSSWLQLFIRVQGLIAAGTFIIAVLGWWLGPVVFEIVSGRPTVVDGTLIAVLVVSSGLVAALCVAAPAVLAQGQHMVYSLGWLVAALVTVVAMLIPGGLVERVTLALIAGPISGLIVHCVWLAVSRKTVRGLGA